jgi:hypothetical protein
MTDAPLDGQIRKLDVFQNSLHIGTVNGMTDIM